MEGLRVTVCFFSFGSLFLLVVVMASDYWTGNSEGAHLGLWQICENTICMPFRMQAPDYIHATRAFLFMGMAAGAVSFLGLCVLLFRTHIGSLSIKGLAASASFAAGFCSLIAMASFTELYNREFSYHTTWLGWPFRTGWVLVALFFITGGLVLR